MKKIALLLVAGFLAIGSVGPASAQADMYGLGTIKCSKYLQNRSESRDIELLYFSWAQGYLSRMNNYETQLSGLQKMNLMPSGFGVTEQITWMNSYCATHGNDFYATAAFEMYRYIRGLNGYTS
jgi:hypothetical protein